MNYQTQHENNQRFTVKISEKLQLFYLSFALLFVFLCVGRPQCREDKCHLWDQNATDVALPKVNIPHNLCKQKGCREITNKDKNSSTIKLAAKSKSQRAPGLLEEQLKEKMLKT